MTKKKSEVAKEWISNAHQRLESKDYGDMATTLNTFKSEPQGFRVTWDSGDLGFGELTFQEEHGKWICDSEAMTPEFVQHVVLNWLKSVKIK